MYDDSPQTVTVIREQITITIQPRQRHKTKLGDDYDVLVNNQLLRSFGSINEALIFKQDLARVLGIEEGKPDEETKKEDQPSKRKSKY